MIFPHGKNPFLCMDSQRLIKTSLSISDLQFDLKHPFNMNDLRCWKAIIMVLFCLGERRLFPMHGFQGVIYNIIHQTPLAFSKKVWFIKCFIRCQHRGRLCFLLISNEIFCHQLQGHFVPVKLSDKICFVVNSLMVLLLWLFINNFTK